MSEPWIYPDEKARRRREEAHAAVRKCLDANEPLFERLGLILMDAADTGASAMEEEVVALRARAEEAEAARGEAVKALDANWVTHQEVVAARAALAERDERIAELEARIERVREMRRHSAWLDADDVLEELADQDKKPTLDLSFRELVERAVSFTKDWQWGQPRWSAVGAVFSVGSTTAKRLCRMFDVDADEARSHEDPDPQEEPRRD